jgi:hypothetical protein
LNLVPAVTTHSFVASCYPENLPATHDLDGGRGKTSANFIVNFPIEIAFPVETLLATSPNETKPSPLKDAGHWDLHRQLFPPLVTLE